MKRFFVKTCILLVTISVLFSSVAYAAVIEPDEPQASRYITSTFARIVPTGNGNFRVDFDVVGTRTLDKLGATQIVIYKGSSIVGRIWYTSTAGSEMMGYNCVVHAGSASYSGVSGEKYHAIVYFYGADSSGGDTKPYTTAVVKV